MVYDKTKQLKQEMLAVNWADSSLNRTETAPWFANNVICKNKAAKGGGIGLIDFSPVLINNTISDNSAQENGGGIHCLGASPRIVNTILWNNKSHKGEQIFRDFGSSPDISYSIVENGYGGLAAGEYNYVDTMEWGFVFTVDPEFSKPSGNDFSLMPTSFCIDAGKPDTLELKLNAKDQKGTNRIEGKHIDIGALEYYRKNKLKSAKTDEEDMEELLTSGVEDLIDLQVSVYPNPSDGRFSIGMQNNPYNRIRMKVTSVSGQLLYDKEYRASQEFDRRINLSSFSYGTYFLNVYSEEGNLLLREKIVIER